MTLQQNRYRRRKTVNALQSVVILAIMVGVMAAVGLLIAGTQGMIAALILMALLLVLTPRVSPALVLRLYRARLIGEREAPELYALLAQLARRAELDRIPTLYYVPSRIMNAFSVGLRDNSAIALTDGLIRALSWNELAGVLAHELSHVLQEDLKIMGLADMLSRFTAVMSNVGIFLLLFYLPALLLAGTSIPLVPIALLIIAPRINLALQMALSRTREFEADLNAVRLTGDPSSLAAALQKIDRYSMTLWDALFMPNRKIPAPSTLRTHPHTERRVRRLRELEERERYIVYPHHLMKMLPLSYPVVERKPGWKFFGLWH